MKLVVVGGVAAGMSLAARTRRLDESAEIVVLERSGYVSFANCGLPYHVGGTIAERDRLILQTPESLHKRFNLDVRTYTEAIAVDAESKTVTVRDVHTGDEYTEPYDELAICTGAKVITLPIPGADLDAVHVLHNVEDMDRIIAQVDAAAVRRAVVVGAGYIGLETAENLRELGWDVHVVELAPQILSPLDHEMVTALDDLMRTHGVQLHLETKVERFDKAENGVVAHLSDGTDIETGLVIQAIGVRPQTELAESAGVELGERGGIVVDGSMRTSVEHIWAAGDVVEVDHTVLPGKFLVPLAGPANRQGRVAADNICGVDSKYTSTQGTSILKLFSMSAGGTGANSRQLDAAGIEYQTVHLHPQSHAGYYPVATPLHLKLLFSPDDGKILGAQAVGSDGVDKRIDVIATMIRLGGTVFDLEHLELSYAPPFGAAKDPVNMAGFLASNVINGVAEVWYPDEDLQGKRVVDVREPDEFETWNIDGSINVPLGTLRKRIDGWDRNEPIRVLCAVGFRSYLAHRILVQEGFTDVSFLSGGSTTYRAWHHRPIDVVENPLGETASDSDETATESGPATGTGQVTVLELDCTGMACPGPIMKLSQMMNDLSDGDEIIARVSDVGFAADAPSWAKRNGHKLLELGPDGTAIKAHFRKGGADLSASTMSCGSTTKRCKNSFVVFSGDLDKVIASFIIANGALAMGNDVSMFFTFWGLNALRDPDAPKLAKPPMEKMMGAMMPNGADALALSQMHMAGAGTAMIKNTMKQHNVPSLPDMIKSARDGGARLIGCTMTMDLLGIKKEELIDGVELGGVATFLDESADSETTLFI